MSANKPEASSGNTPSYNPEGVDPFSSSERTGRGELPPMELNALLIKLFGEGADLSNLSGREFYGDGYFALCAANCPLPEVRDEEEGAVYFWEIEGSGPVILYIYTITTYDTPKTIEEASNNPQKSHIKVAFYEPTPWEEIRASLAQ